MGKPIDPIRLIQQRLEKISLRGLALQIGCSAPYLSDVLKGHRTPGPKILKFLGVHKVVKHDVSYVLAGTSK